MQITTIGLDLAKRVFQVHAVDASGDVVVRKALRRSQVLPFFTKLPPCLIGIEACGTSHHWAWPWPTRWPAWSGRSWLAARSTKLAILPALQRKTSERLHPEAISSSSRLTGSMRL